jgi:GH24 family phage-related lysozyme (muramidase)
MADKWHDINAPGVWQKPNQDTPQSGSTQPADAAEDAPPEPPKPLVKLSEGKFVPPDEGTEINKKCPVQVNVEYLDDSAKSMQKVTLSLYANYQDTVSNLSHYVDGFEKDGIAQAEMTMYPPPGYKEGDSVDYFFKAEHIRGEKIIDSEDLTLPMETKSIILQKGDYDENGAQKYNKEQSGDNFKPNNIVKKLQGDLITTSFLPKGFDDGFFGDNKDFQSAAADATFVVNGKLTIFDQKLTGFRKEELCPNTQEYLKMVVDKRGVVPAKQKATSASENGIQFIMQQEGFKEMPYNDSVDNATIGYGTLLHLGAVTDDDRKNYLKGISKDEAKNLLVAKVREFEPKLNTAVKVDLNQNQFDALIDWTYNLGSSKLNENNCTWLRELNQGYYDKVPAGLLMWNKASKDGVMVDLPGLTTRRQEEGALFKKQ